MRNVIFIGLVAGLSSFGGFTLSMRAMEYFDPSARLITIEQCAMTQIIMEMKQAEKAKGGER